MHTCVCSFEADEDPPGTLDAALGVAGLLKESCVCNFEASETPPNTGIAIAEWL